MDKTYISAVEQALEPYGLKITGQDESGFTAGGHVDCGTKGFDGTISVNRNAALTTVTVKGTGAYNHPLRSQDSSEWLHKVSAQDGYQSYSIYYNKDKQLVNVSKSVNIPNRDATAESVGAQIKRHIDAIKEIVASFESSCVDFTTEEAASAESAQAESAPMRKVSDKQSSASPEEVLAENQRRNADYTKDVFLSLAKEKGAQPGKDKKGREFFTVPAGENLTLCVTLARAGNYITIAEQTPVSEDKGSMYAASARKNNKDLKAKYQNGLFSVYAFVYPDQYRPEAVPDAISAVDAGIKKVIEEWKDTTDKLSSTNYTADMQKILEEQAAKLTEREKKITEKEGKLRQQEAALAQKHKDAEKELEASRQQLEERHKALDKKEQELEKKETESKQQAKAYEKRNTEDVMKMQRLAEQIADLQNRLDGGSAYADEDAEEEIMALKEQVRQTTIGRLAAEKTLKQQISEQDNKIASLMDTVREKDMELQKQATATADSVTAGVNEKMKEKEAYIKRMEEKLQAVGHLVTAKDLMSYFSQKLDDSAGLEEQHGKNNIAYIVFKQDGLNVRIRIGETNFVEISKNTVAPDKTLGVLNAKYSEVKFYANAVQKKTFARSYFADNAEPEEIDDLVQLVSQNFQK